MKTKIALLALSILSCVSVQASDIRDEAVLNSKFVKAVLAGLKKEQGLLCKVVEDESNLTIQYYSEDGYSKFKLLALCSDGRSAIIEGKIGDGGQTASEKFQLVWAN